MTTEERFQRIEANLDRLTGVVGTLADTAVSHDNQIEAIITAIERANADAAQTRAQVAAATAALADLTRQLQAYLTRIPPQ